MTEKLRQTQMSRREFIWESSKALGAALGVLAMGGSLTTSAAQPQRDAEPDSPSSDSDCRVGNKYDRVAKACVPGRVDQPKVVAPAVTPESHLGERCKTDRDGAPGEVCIFSSPNDESGTIFRALDLSSPGR